MPDTKKMLPPNIKEFNEISAMIFAELYKSFPLPKVIPPEIIATQLGVSPTDKLPSGRTFHDMYVHSLNWLTEEGFLNKFGGTAAYRCSLSARAMAAMNAFPPSLGQSVGAELIEATKDGASESGKTKIAEIMGNFFGAFAGSIWKTMGGS